MPKISVIIPTFNRAHIIRDTLESVINQTYKDWECLIIDDISNDNTEEVLESFLREDVRFKYFRRPLNRKKGATVCRNIGLEMASGDYIQFLDSDDVIAFNKFKVQLAALEDASPNAIATCKWGGFRMEIKNAKIYNGLATYLSTRNSLDLLEIYGSRLTYLPSHAFLIPESLIKKSGRWKEFLSVNDDGEFFSRVILNSSEIIHCKNTYVLYRSGAGGRLSGRIYTDEGLSSYMESLDLINKNIYETTGIYNHIYVKQRKAELYNNINRKFPEIIARNTPFFKERTTVGIYLTRKLFYGLQSRIRKRFK